MQRTEPVAEAGQSLRIDGHFGEFLQGRLGPSGPVVLVTLPSRVHGVAATRLPGGPLRLTGGLVRAGRVVAPLPPVPEMAVLGGLWGPARPTRAGDERYPDIADLVAAWQAAPGAAALARLAAESAARTLRLRGPAEDPTPALAARLGAAGWMMSHSGAARGLIFAPGAVPGGAAAALTRAGFRKLVVLGPGGWPLPRPQE